jgi:hypothetical protein
MRRSLSPALTTRVVSVKKGQLAELIEGATNAGSRTCARQALGICRVLDNAFVNKPQLFDRGGRQNKRISIWQTQGTIEII